MIELKLSEIASFVGGTLYGQDTSCSSVSIDTRSIRAGDLFVALRGERFDAHTFIEELPSTVSGVVTEVKKDVSFPQIVVENTTRALGLLGKLCREKAAPEYVVGVTGSVGKTTTKEMVTDVLSNVMTVHSTAGNFNNTIGLPLTLIGMKEGSRAAVLEMGMSEFGEISYLSSLALPNVALITNVGMSHIENLGSREGIRDAKLEIVDGMRAGDLLILNGDEPLLRDEVVRERTKHLNVVYVGFNPENDYYPADIYRGRNYLSFDVITPDGEERVTIPAIGDHFVLNALFACAVGRALGADSDQIQRGFSSYEPQGLRQRMYESGDVTVIADCYNAGPESMAAALKVLGGRQGRKLAVLGDMMELGSMTRMAHRQVGAVLAEEKIDLLFTYGSHSAEIATGALEHGMKRESVRSFTQKEALCEALRQTLRAGDCILFKASRRMKLEEIIDSCDLGE